MAARRTAQQVHETREQRIEADRERFALAWRAEVDSVPEFSEGVIHIVAGLLLPIWKRLPNESTRVYRLQTDAGERIIGRKVSAAWAANALASGAPTLTPETAFAALIQGQVVLDLAEGLQLRRVRVMGVNRIELSGFSDAMRDRLEAALRDAKADFTLETYPAKHGWVPSDTPVHDAAQAERHQ